MRAFIVAPTHVHTHAIARDVSESNVEGGNNALDKTDKFCVRFIVIRNMPFECEIGAIDLQNEAVVYDRFIFKA